MSTPLPRVIPELWLPSRAKVERVILHWTAGGPNPSVLDLAHYHLLFDQSGKAHRGARPVGLYLPHTRQMNTGSVGVSFCGMAGAVQGKTHGKYPLTKVQIERGCQGIADVLAAYDLAVTERTCLTHAEVTRVYNVVQRGKWDILTLPPFPDVEPDQCGEYLRDKVRWYLKTQHGR